MWFHQLLNYLGFGPSATGLTRPTTESRLDAIFLQAMAANPKLWQGNSAHAPTRQLKLESFALWLAVNWPPTPAQQRDLLEAAIERLAIGLREAGVGDMSVSKEIRAMAGALHGRLKVYHKLIKNNDIKEFTKVALQHNIAATEAQTAWGSTQGLGPKAKTKATGIDKGVKRAAKRKKPLPKPRKTVKARQ